MKQIKPKTNLEQLLQPVTESTEEALCGGGRPAGGGGDCPPIFDVIDSVQSPTSETSGLVGLRLIL